jgi:hypothetical protein
MLRLVIGAAARSRRRAKSASERQFFKGVGTDSRGWTMVAGLALGSHHPDERTRQAPPWCSVGP